MCVCVCVRLGHFAGQQKWTGRCTPAIIKKKKKKEKTLGKEGPFEATKHLGLSV